MIAISAKNRLTLSGALEHPLLKDEFEILKPSKVEFNHQNSELRLDDVAITVTDDSKLCGLTKTPTRYPSEIRSQMLGHDLSKLFDSGERGVVLKNREIFAFNRTDLFSLAPRQTVEVLLETVPSTDMAATDITRMSFDDSCFSLDLVSRKKNVEVHQGDILEAGLSVRSWPFSDRATQVNGFILRLSGSNGQTHRECVGSGGGRRSRRLPIGNDRNAAEGAQRTQLASLVNESWTGLQARLNAIPQLTVERVDVAAVLEQSLRRARLFSQCLLDRLIEVWIEESEGEANLYGVMNALTWLGTHDPSISTRQSMGLTRIAGIISGRSVHICKHCWSLAS